MESNGNIDKMEVWCVECPNRYLWNRLDGCTQTRNANFVVDNPITRLRFPGEDILKISWKSRILGGLHYIRMGIYPGKVCVMGLEEVGPEVMFPTKFPPS